MNDNLDGNTAALVSGLIKRLKSYIPRGDGYNDPIALDIARAIDIIESQERGIAELVETLEMARDDMEMLGGVNMKDVTETIAKHKY